MLRYVASGVVNALRSYEAAVCCSTSNILQARISWHSTPEAAVDAAASCSAHHGWRCHSTMSTSEASTSQQSQVDLWQPAQPAAQRTRALYAPWTPTRQLLKKKGLATRMRFLVTSLEQEQTHKSSEQQRFPDFRSGDILEVTVRAPENQGKIYMFKGVCIGRCNKGIRSSFKLYNVFPDVGGFVQHFPLHMPDLVKIQVVGRVPARRSKLYYMMERETKEYMFQSNPKGVK